MLIGAILIAYLALVLFALLRERSWRLAAAFLIAPLAPAVAMGASNPPMIIVFAPFCYFFGLLAIPAYFVLRHFRLRRLWHFASVGVAMGMVAGVLMQLQRLLSASTVDPGNALAAGLYGFIAAIAFWVVAFAGKPSNSSLEGRRSTSAAQL